jgi:class 3 adenylate cyclase
MAIKDLLLEINADVKDILSMGFELTKTQSDYVPNHEDSGLTFESGQTKKAKTIETCVLYADIRNSTVLSQSKPQKEMARLYTAFTKSVMTVAEYHGGVIRNIIGDRVMVIFPQKNCFQSAIDTAISINTVSSNIINKHFNGIDFKCGIGIDFGEKLVIKAGIPKQDKERANYKNLIWISNSANIASKLTDVANKEIIKKMYRITYNPINWSSYMRMVPVPINSSTTKELYLSSETTKEISAEEFADKMNIQEGGGYTYFDGRLLSFEKLEKKINSSPILVSSRVFTEYKKLDPNKEEFMQNWWTDQDVFIKEYSEKVYGCNLSWDIKDIHY